MRQMQNNNKRMRGRGRKSPNPLTKVYESNGPEVKIRGTAQQVADKYMAMARDASSSGDRVMAESLLQHAEHYLRIIASAQSQAQQRQERQSAQEKEGQEGDVSETDATNEATTNETDVVEEISDDENTQQENSDVNEHEDDTNSTAQDEDKPAPKKRTRRAKPKIVEAVDADDEPVKNDTEQLDLETEAAPKPAKKPRAPRRKAVSNDNDSSDIVEAVKEEIVAETLDL